MSEEDNLDRRSNQRVFTAQQNHPRFWLLHEGMRLPVIDLSLKGFSFYISAPPKEGQKVDFELVWEAGEDAVTGRARIVNFLGTYLGGQVGCEIEEIDPAHFQRLTQWLVAHVKNTAAVPISENEIMKIVSGPSFV
jgi:hypothetical protein